MVYYLLHLHLVTNQYKPIKGVGVVKIHLMLLHC